MDGSDSIPSADIRQPFHRLVNRYRHKDGHEVYTESTGAPIFDEQGKLIKWRGVDHDITARKAFEDALRVRDRAIEATHVGIVIADAQAQGNPNIYVNPALSRITGYSREELLRQNMRLLQGPDTDPAAVEQIRQAINTGRSCEVVLKNYRKEGAPFWNELLISPVVDDTGKLTHYIGIQTDVTERRRAEESRHELEIAKHIQLSLLPDAPLRSADRRTRRSVRARQSRGRRLFRLLSHFRTLWTSSSPTCPATALAPPSSWPKCAAPSERQPARWPGFRWGPRKSYAI